MIRLPQPLFQPPLLLIKPPLLLLRHLLQMIKLDLGPYPLLLVRHSLLDPIHNAPLEIVHLLLVVPNRLLQHLGKLSLFRLLLADRLPQLRRFLLHLHLVRPLLDVWVVGLLVLPRFVVHLLQPVALGVGVWTRARRPVDVVDLGKGALGVFDRPHNFAVLVSRAPEADRHSLAVEPGEDTG
jgi:hypothetical protein